MALYSFKSDMENQLLIIVQNDFVHQKMSTLCGSFKCIFSVRRKITLSVFNGFCPFSCCLLLVPMGVLYVNGVGNNEIYFIRQDIFYQKPY